MLVNNDYTAADARDAYFSWNKKQFKRLELIAGTEKYSFIQIIPLLFQLNDRFLPGYAGADVPLGVHGYSPDKNVLASAKGLNSKFNYNKQSVVRFPAVDSILMQHQLLDNALRCWLFYRDTLNPTQQDELSEKVERVRKWFSSRGLKIEFLLTTEEKFKRFKFRTIDCDAATVYLDQFYSETILLAGKYPAWWLIPNAEESQYASFLENIKELRLVDTGDVLDLGSVVSASPEQLLTHLVKLVQHIRGQPEHCLFELLLLDAGPACFEDSNGLARRLKASVYQGDYDIDVCRLISTIILEGFDSNSDIEHLLSPGRLFALFRQNTSSLSQQLLDALNGDNVVHSRPHRGIESIVSFMNLNKSVLHEIRQVYEKVFERCLQTGRDISEKVILHARNVQASISDNADRIPIYNNRLVNELVLDRILLRFVQAKADKGYWSLVIRLSEANEKSIEGFSSLVGLLAWCWLNRIVNLSTQVSVESPGQQVKQTEVRYVLEVLVQHLDPEKVSSVTSSDLSRPVKPVQSIIFIHLTSGEYLYQQEIAELDDPLSFGDVSQSLVPHCDQLIVNNWGDVYTRSFIGNASMINCLCEWTHAVPVGRWDKPPPLMFSGYGAGNSTYIAQRLSEVYQGLVEYFYTSRQKDGRFIVRSGRSYYAVAADEDQLFSRKLGPENNLFSFLESSLPHFQHTMLERLAYTEHPLKDIYTHNRANVVQVFYQFTGRQCYTWVLDERGSLFRHVQTSYDRDSFIMQWLYFYKNIAARLKKISFQETDIPELEITHLVINRLGEIDFVPVSPASISVDKRFFDIRLSITGADAGDQLDVSLDGHAFSFSSFQQTALAECVKEILSRIRAEGRKPVYVTDIDVPLRLYNVSERGQIQFSHILKFKRSFERRIHHLMNELQA